MNLLLEGECFGERALGVPGGEALVERRLVGERDSTKGGGIIRRPDVGYLGGGRRVDHCGNRRTAIATDV
ncbi:MAG: hypothetical protein VW239_10815 [Candidatus Nanopelagicales bacterium]